MISNYASDYIRTKLREINTDLHSAYKTESLNPVFRLKVLSIHDNAQRILDILNKVEGAKNAEHYIDQK